MIDNQNKQTRPEPERIQAELVETFESEIDLALQMFKEEQRPPIEDLRKEPQSVWNAALMYVRSKVFSIPGMLKQKGCVDIPNRSSVDSNFNCYDYKLVNHICDYYIYLCMLYDKEISCIGFSLLTGIDRYTIATWKNEGNKLDPLSSDIGKKIYDFREESLSVKLTTGNKNPVGVLAILNRHYAWNMPGVSREAAKQPALNASQLPKLGREIVAIADTIVDDKEPPD